MGVELIILKEAVNLSGVCQKLPATVNEGFAEASGIFVDLRRI